jgi:hypothetical protein
MQASEKIRTITSHSEVNGKVLDGKTRWRIAERNCECAVSLSSGGISSSRNCHEKVFHVNVTVSRARNSRFMYITEPHPPHSSRHKTWSDATCCGHTAANDNILHFMQCSRAAAPYFDCGDEEKGAIVSRSSNRRKIMWLNGQHTYHYWTDFLICIRNGIPWLRMSPLNWCRHTHTHTHTTADEIEALMKSNEAAGIATWCSD